MALRLGAWDPPQMEGAVKCGPGGQLRPPCLPFGTATVDPQTQKQEPRSTAANHGERLFTVALVVTQRRVGVVRVCHHRGHSVCRPQYSSAPAPPSSGKTPPSPRASLSNAKPTPHPCAHWQQGPHQSCKRQAPAATRYTAPQLRADTQQYTTGRWDAGWDMGPGGCSPLQSRRQQRGCGRGWMSLT
jgi:hypothetical protein